ncbi:TAXI family TRAP transporter solute-binding subunit [Alloalcanivorax xenomutans]|uniref:TAXI family TRAP transporter solute-binding subunit n=1 Tax=Alloalcanivorax xenomutans TaxID=1094342 RepID=UPI003D9B528A
MKLKHPLIRWASGLVLLATVSLASYANADTNLRMHTAQPGSSPYVFSVTLQSVLQKHLPVRINMTSSMASTRSTLDAAKGQVDLYIGSQSINHFMSTGTGMFSKMSSAPELFKNIRTIMSFPLGPYHIMVHEKSGIRSLKDIKDRRVFIGPPGGAATLVALSIIEGATGYKAGEDYEMAKLDWNSGQQAFQDGQVDMYIGPTQLPSASIEQVVLLQKVRFLGIPEEAFDSEPMKQVMSLPGRTIAEIPAGIYGENQTNEGPVKTVGTWVTLGTQKDLDPELGYQITKTIFENLQTFHDAAKFMDSITLENALNQVNTPLQAGALRYYREIGLDMPDAMVPPEAR